MIPLPHTTERRSELLDLEAGRRSLQRGSGHLKRNGAFAKETHTVQVQTQRPISRIFSSGSSECFMHLPASRNPACTCCPSRKSKAADPSKYSTTDDAAAVFGHLKTAYVLFGINTMSYCKVSNPGSPCRIDDVEPPLTSPPLDRSTN